MKDSIKALNAYNVLPYEADVKLDANESNHNLYAQRLMPNVVFGRYPDTDAKGLSKAIKSYLKIKNQTVLVGNGSSELLDLVVKTFVSEDDSIMAFSPSFSMYKQYAAVYGARFLEVPLNDDFTFDRDAMINCIAQEAKLKVIFIASPNNPTGTTILKEDLVKILNATKALVVLDEAYYEFSEEQDFLSLLDQHQNLLVARTFSKAYGLAALRVGYIIANEAVASWLKKVQAPYSVNTVSQTVAKEAILKAGLLKGYVQEIRSLREAFIHVLSSLGVSVYPSEANFVFFKAENALYDYLLNEGILVRQFVLEQGCFYRVSIGTQEEMANVTMVIKEFYEKRS